MNETVIEIQLPEKMVPLLAPMRYKAIYGGRGTAKSHSVATALLVLAQQYPLRILCCREVQLSIKDSVKQLLEDKIASHLLTAFYQSTQNEIKGVNGSRFIFTGLGKMTTDQIKSMEGIDIAWVEESQTISAHSLEVIVPTIRNSNYLPEAELWFTWNPRNASDPVDKLFRGEIVPPDSLIINMMPEDNAFFPPVLRKEMEFDKLQKPERFAHIWLGEYEPMAIGAIWSRMILHQCRRSIMPEMGRILVGVDPAVSHEEGSNEHGIIVGGLGADERGYVLDDMTTKGNPAHWAQRALSAFDKWDADSIVIEINQGGDMCRHTLESQRPGVPIIEVRATRGHHVRAEPISALYDAGRISHIGTFPQLESQMCQMVAGGYEGEGSPDRVDALVWVMTELFPSLVKKTVEEVHVEHLGESAWMG